MLLVSESVPGPKDSLIHIALLVTFWINTDRCEYVVNLELHILWLNILQVGNAVPPPMAKAIGIEIRKSVENVCKKEKI